MSPASVGRGLDLLDYAVVPTGRGDVLVLATRRGVSGVILGCDQALLDSLHALPPTVGTEGGGRATAAARQLRRYFKGRPVSFDVALDWSKGTAFQRRVWEVTRRIPHGQVWSYKALATATGAANASRAVGQALAANPTPILVPCHRVIYLDGSLGGYTAGVGWKEWLLALEDVQLKIKLR
jgi:methylated-DNA-[protein]-cysteine S-methyltransferase